MMKIRRALISVSDKSGVVEFAKELCQMGVEIVSTGGTMKTLRAAFSWVSMTRSKRRPPNGRTHGRLSKAPAPAGPVVTISSISPSTTPASGPR